MVETDLKFNDAALNTWSDEDRFEVTGDGIVHYAKATNDPIPAHLAGDVAPPVFGIVPVFESMLVPAVEVVPIELIPRVVHGEQDFHFHRAIRPGDKLVSRAKMIGYEGLEKGTRAAILVETQHVDKDQTFRYASASGDPMPIHLDEEVAKAAGRPGIIAHGMCTMAFASWAVLTEVAGSEVDRLKRFAVRFSKMVIPGDDLETRIWRAGSADGTTSYAFETARGADLVLTDGLAVIAD